MDAERRRARREQQALEVEASQEALRKSIDETRRLMDASDEMIARHRRECEEDEKEV
jgi:hypothetical protein